MRILITGGAGFIGRALIKYIRINSDYQVTILDNFSEQIHGDSYAVNELIQSLNKEVKVVEGDVRNLELVNELVHDCDAIVHLASETGTGQSMYEIKKYCDVNVNGTGVLLDAIVNSKRKNIRLLLASSRSIYGEGRYLCLTDGYVFPTTRHLVDMEKGVFDLKCPKCHGRIELTSTDETSLLDPQSIYAVTKLTQEQLVMTAGSASEFPVCALRLQNVYGPGQSLKNPYTGILSIFSTAILNGEPLNIFEDGKESRDFVFVDDVAKAFFSALTSADLKAEIYNVGSGQPVDVSTVAKMLFKEFAFEPRMLITGQFRMGDIRHNYADISKISEAFDFKPEVGFDEGLNRFCEWVKTQETEKSM